MGSIGRLAHCVIAFAFLAAGTASHAIVSTTSGTSLLGSGVSFLDGVAKLTLTRNDGTFGCSGSLVGGGAYILTAAHCVSGDTGSSSTSSINVSLLGGSVTTTATSYVVAPGWSGNLTAGNDLAVIRLANAITGVTSYSLYTTQSAQGSTVVLAGYGLTGTGLNGSTPGTFGTLHYGYNQYDSTTNNGLTATYLFDFDGGGQRNRFGSTGLGDQEAMIASGDSGGPSLLQVNSTWMLVGVHSFDSCSGNTCPVNSSFGEVGADISVFGNAAWLQSTIVVAVPEPATQAMFAAGLMMLGVMVRRRARPR